MQLKVISHWQGARGEDRHQVCNLATPCNCKKDNASVPGLHKAVLNRVDFFLFSSCCKLISLKIFLRGCEWGTGRPQIHSMSLTTLLLNDWSLKLKLATSNCFSHRRFPASEFCIRKSQICSRQPEVLCRLLLYSAGFFFSLRAAWGATTLHSKLVL